jgi:hypothetical protein
MGAEKSSETLVSYRNIARRLNPEDIDLILTEFQWPLGYHFTLMMEAAKSSETLVSYRNITRRHDQEDL